MRVIHRRRLHSLLLATPLLLAAACRNSTGSRPSEYEPLVCGRGDGSTATAEVGPAGGRVAVRGHSLSVPAQAVTSSTRFSITERDTTYVAVEVQPHGQPFARNATLTLSYARCGGQPFGYQNLRIVEVKSGTTDVIRVMPSTVDSTSRTVSTAGLNHLSGYLIGGT